MEKDDIEQTLTKYRGKLFEHVEPTSDQKEGNARLTPDCSAMSEKSGNMVDIQEAVRNLEALINETGRMQVAIPTQTVVGQSYSGNPASFCMPQASLVPAQMPARDQGKRQGNKAMVDIDNAEFVYSGGKLFAVDNEQSQYVGNFAVEILERKEKITEIVNEASEVIGSESQLFWYVKIMLSDKEYRGYVNDIKFMELAWIARISQRRAALSSSSNAKKLVMKYLQDLVMAERYREVKEFASCGWKWFENGTVCYLTADGAIGFDGNSVKAVDTFKLYTKPMERTQIFRD